MDSARYSLLSGVAASDLDFSSHRTRVSSAAQVTSSSVTNLSKAAEFFKMSVPASGIILAVGSPSSGIQDFVASFSDSIVLRGSQFSSEESYNSIGGAAPGYMGSDTVSRFVQQLQAKKSSPIIIENISAAKASLLSDFVSQIQDGKILDKTGIVGSVDVSSRKFVFVLSEEIQTDVLLSEDSLREKITKLRTSSGTQIVPYELLDAASIAFFPNISDLLKEYSSALITFSKNPTPLKYIEAISEFSLSNREIFDLSASSIQIESRDTEKILLASGKIYKQTKTLGESTFRDFDTSLSKYYGQDEAVSAFQDALALKVQSKTKRPTSLFCVGPPGVGKTQLAKLLGESIGGFCRIDSNVIRSTQDLFGSSYEQGLLTKTLTKGTPSVILFDEIEKMDTKSILGTLQLIDEGRLYDAYTKESWSLAECLIVFTSNAIRDPNVSESEARELLKQRFPEEFIDRQDFIVPFRHYSLDEKKRIATEIAASTGITMSDDELENVVEADSIRQIQLSIQRIKASKATKSLKSRKI